MAETPAAQPAFYFDLGDPGCYLTAERILAELPVLAEWQPVHGRVLGWTPPALDAEALAATVARDGLQPLRLPGTWPPDSEFAMKVATYAKGAGKTVAFSLAAFRQVFAGGRDLSDESTVLIAAAACEMHPAAVLKGAGLRSIAATLQRTSERAAQAGVTQLPAIVTEAGVFQGGEALERATEALTATRA